MVDLLTQCAVLFDNDTNTIESGEDIDSNSTQLKESLGQQQKNSKLAVGKASSTKEKVFKKGQKPKYKLAIAGATENGSHGKNSHSK